MKLRVIGRQQQLLRIDFEKPPSREVLAAKLEEFERALADCDVVILSDYGKGGLTHIAEMIRAARKAGKRVLVDPKGDDYARYKGATHHHARTAPSCARWSALEGREGPQARAPRRCATKLGLEALLLTRGEDGMTLFTQGEPATIPAGAGARGVRRHRRGRHGDRDARRDARRRRRPARPRCASPTAPPASSSASSAPRSRRRDELFGGDERRMAET